MAALYKGYSSHEFNRIKQFEIYDIELVKMDLLNHIFTKRGERVNMPEFGTIIPELTFEPLDSETLETLEEELEYVFDYDPRVATTELQVIPDFDNSSVNVIARLFYIELQLVDNFELNIEFKE